MPARKSTLLRVCASVAAAAVVATLVVGATQSLAAPRILTNKMAYVGGESVDVSGHGFLPFEVVSVHVAGMDRGLARTMIPPVTVFADADGKIQTSLKLDRMDRTAGELAVVATGQSSDKSVQSEFRFTAVIKAET